MEEVLAEFLVESREGLDRLDRDLVTLEETPNDRELVARIFRSAHTIKGTSGFLGFSKLEALTHGGESLLSRVRDGELAIDDDKISALLAMVDAIRNMLGEIEVGGTDGDGDYTELTERLKVLSTGGAAPAPRPAPAPSPKPAASAPAPAPPPPPPPETPVSAAEPPAAAEPAPAHHESHHGNETVRVDVALIDHLMDFAGELVLTRNQILQLPPTHSDPTLAAAAQRLNLITMALQEGIMRMRMQPVDHVFSKFPRMVRDLSRACRKLVRVELDGKHTELDKTLIEAIKDPLTHLLRNAVDHGIEAPDVRQARGKHPEGKILVRAFHQGGQVNIEITDDGSGIPLDRVKEKALTRGLVTPEQVANFSESDLTGLIFLPGFSTASEVTNVSGRGVGMDVVKTNVENIGGTVEVETRPGQGTTFRLRIPLTLAIVPALIVTSSADRFAIPQVNLLELVRVEEGRNEQLIEYIHGAPVYRLRGKLLPLVIFDEQLGRPAETGQSFYIVVLQASGRQFGLVVQNVTGQQEIVVKPLPRQVKEVGLFAGATILGDGRVALILDTLGLAQKSHVVSELRERTALPRLSDLMNAAQARTTYLLFRGPDDGRMAVPLEKVTRLEIIPKQTFESSGAHEAIQYRDAIMPVVPLEQIVVERRTRPRNTDLPAAASSDEANVIVFERSEAYVGVEVADILDIVEGPSCLQATGVRPGVAGTLVIQQRIAEVIDIEYLLETVLGPVPQALRPTG
ncbi:MAG: chemotaxis protein CheA [Myxococcales bacterium]|nr:chemotaxis protein CheA [Myxococcales bacterium]